MYYLIKTYSLVILQISCIALIVAYSMQFFFDIEPCTLCYYQRIPYFVAAFCSALFLYLSARIRSETFTAVYLCFMFVLFLVGMVISVYHFGVENGWFIYKSTCTGYIQNPESIEALRKMLEKASNTPCNLPGPKVFGISVPGWNGVVFFLMSAFTVGTAMRRPSV